MITATHKQNILDIALQAYGNAQAVFDLSLANGIGITDNLTTGRILHITASTYTNIDIKNFYKQNNIKPATALPFTLFEGIDYWGIEHDFIIQ